MTTLVDTHCHVAFDAFDEDREAVLGRAREAGVAACVVVAVDVPSGADALALARAAPGFAVATAGLHPNEPTIADPAAFAAVREQIASGGFHAVGETGLDAYRDSTSAEDQVASLRRHLRLALEHDLPAILHCRDAFAEIASVLGEFRGEPLRGVLHCFTGEAADLPPLLEAGLHVGVGGIATFKQRADLRDAVRQIPPERLLLETDAPFLAPEPRRGRRNEPAWVAHVADRVAETLALDRDELARVTTANADALFRLGLGAAA